MTGADPIARLAHTPRLLVALDFDGTLSPLVDAPMSARMLPASRAALESLLATPDTVVALVSGRSLRDLREIAEHGDDSRILLAGSHGAEHWTPGEGRSAREDDPSETTLRDRLRAHAVAATQGMPGVWIEPKAFGFGVHTRVADAATAAAAHAAVDAVVAADAPHWRRRTGFDIVEYAFRHEGKDTAVAALREATRATGVLFAGDDVTDEDALASLGPDDVGVHVGDGPSAASVLVPDISAMAALLARLAQLREGSRRAV